MSLANGRLYLMLEPQASNGAVPLSAYTGPLAASRRVGGVPRRRRLSNLRAMTDRAAALFGLFRMQGSPRA